jgi:hypothetical protein
MTRRIAVTLTEPQWQTVMHIIGRQPFNDVAPLITEMTRQLQAELNLARHLPAPDEDLSP